MCESFSLTENESEIMNLLWKQARALSRSEIIHLLPDRSWSSSSIHIILNKLIDKEAVKVEGFVKTGRNFGRTYSAAIAQDEYRDMQIRRAAGKLKGGKIDLLAVFSALVHDEEIDSNTIAELETILKEKKAEIRRNTDKQKKYHNF
jgi:predicted transcriptional regulator